jgi:hypothetical protein
MAVTGIEECENNIFDHLKIMKKGQRLVLLAKEML